MTRLVKIFLGLLHGLFVLSGPALAGHIMGGEVYYTYLGNDQFTVTVSLYRECYDNGLDGNNLDQTVQVGVFENNASYGTYTFSLVSSSTVPVQTVLENPCGNLPEDLCMQRLLYVKTLILPPNTAGYDIVFQRCCRNPGIVNVDNPANIGITLHTEIPPFTDDSNPNSSPIFNTFPPEAICSGFDFFLDQSATDPDGDSLVYSFCQPMHGGTPTDPAPAPSPPSTFTNIPYTGGFSAANPITADPDFVIDENTGQITGFPTQVGAFVIGICVSEYRDGEFLSHVLRDIQINVVNCDPTIIASTLPQTAEQLCIGQTMTFTENSVGADFFFWDFGVEGTNSDTSNLANPTFTYPDTGTYVISLIANPGWPCADTSEQTFYVYEPIEPEIQMVEFMCSEDLEYFNFEGLGAFSGDMELTWVFPGGTPGAANIEDPGWVHFNNAENWTVSLTASHYGCSADTQFAWVAPPDPVASITDQSSFCQGMTFDFVNASLNAESYSWDFGLAGNDDVSNDFEPTFTYPYEGLFDVELIAYAENTCPDTAHGFIEIFPLLDPTFDAPEPDCFTGHLFDLLVSAQNEEGTVYSWDFGGAVEGVNAEEDVVQNLVYSEPGYYDVTVTALANGCEFSHTETLWVIEDPQVQFQGGPLLGCPPHLVNFSNLSSTETATSYLWHFGDGETSPATSPSHVYTFSGDFTVSLEMTTGGFCEQELILVQPGLVDILQEPLAGFDITPNQVDIFNPVVEVVSLAEGAVTCFYSFGDGGSLEGFEGAYTYSEGGLFTVNQTVINEAGCSATAIGQVSVSGSAFYAPTAFTPNGDGVNDVWRPTALGVTKYLLTLFNRWGEVVWTTDNTQTPWQGQVMDGKHFAPDGVYFYEVWFEDQVHYPQTQSGHIHLIR